MITPVTPAPTPRAILYARVSLARDQVLDNQLLPLRRHAEQQFWAVTELVDQASGAKSDRPGYVKMLELVRAGQVDVICCWALDRLGRSLAETVRLIDELNALKVRLVVLNGAGGGLDTTTPAGLLVVHILSAVASWERSWLQERTKAGLQRARAEGKRLGGIPLTKEREELILRLRTSGKSLNTISYESKHGISAISRVLRERGDPLQKLGSRGGKKPAG